MTFSLIWQSAHILALHPSAFARLFPLIHSESSFPWALDGAVLRWTCFGATVDEKLPGRRRNARPRGARSTTTAEVAATRAATATAAEEEEEEEETVHKTTTTPSRHHRLERKRRTHGIFRVIPPTVAVAVAVQAAAVVTVAKPP